MKTVYMCVLATSSILLSVLTHAQLVSGVVVNNVGSPIENALVSRSDDPYVFAKTDDNGEFSIPGDIGQSLHVAALHFETNRFVPVSTTTNLLVVLQDDSKLVSDVFHINFDHLRPGAGYTKEELKTDFPVGYGKGVYQNGNAYTDRTTVDPTMSVDGSGSSLKVKFPAGELKTEYSGIDTRIPLAGKFNDNTFAEDEIYLSYWIKFSDNFDFSKCGGKLPSLGGSVAFEREKEWKGRIMWRNGGSIQFYMELPHDGDGIEHDSLRFWGDLGATNGFICTNEFTSYLTTGVWHNIELHYKMETPGQNDGLFEGWIDGSNGHKIISSEVFGLYRKPGEGMDNLTTNAILLSAFLGGSSIDYEMDEDVYAWFDEFRVSTERINSYDEIMAVTKANELSPASTSITAYPNPSENGIFNLNKAQRWQVFLPNGQEIEQGLGKVVDISSYGFGVYYLKTEDHTLQLVR